jgi:hypothetical protein
MNRRSHALRRRYGHAHGVFQVAVDPAERAPSFKRKQRALEHARYLENRGYAPYVYEFNEEKPERHRRIIHGPGKGSVAPPYRGGA